MYIRTTRLRYDPAREDEFVRIWEEAVIPVVQHLPGFKGYQGSIDRDSGTAISIVTWDTAEHARFSRDRIAAAVSQLQAVGVQLEPSEVYEVRVEA